MTTMLTLAALFLVAAAFFAPLSKRAGFSSIVGYLVAGILIGPSGLGFVAGDEEVESILILAEFGVVLLLFLIGLELRPQRLWALRTDIFGAGAMQVAATTVALGGLGIAMGYGVWQSIVIAGALALSSTAFVLQFLGERGQLAQRHGRMGFSILLMQDIAAIPLIAFIPVIGVSSASDPFTLADLAVMVATIALVLVVGRYVLRYVYRFVASTGVPEGMTAAALLTVVTVTLLMNYVGLSAALGAFLAGMLIGGSEYRHEIEANIQPFERILLGVFFTAVGMGLDLGLLIEEPARIIGLALGIMAVKCAVLFAIGLWRGLKPGSALLLGAALAQGGEFAFVVFGVAYQNGLLPDETQTELIVAVTLSIAFTPFLYWIAEWFAALGHKPRGDDSDMPDHDERHVIVVGFGPFGQIPSRVLSAMNIPFTALENRAERIDFVRRFGADVYYGDATRQELLEAAGAGTARALIVALEDQEQNTKVVEIVRRHYPDLPIFARAHDRFHAHELLDLGAQAVQRESYHSALALTQDLLTGLGETPSRAQRIVRMFREQDETRFVEDRAYYQDVEKVRASAARSHEELERQFQKDRETPDEPHGANGKAG